VLGIQQQQAVGSLESGHHDHRMDTTSMGDSLPYTDLGTGLQTRNVSLGMHFACAIVSNNSMLKCWGANQYGQLGINDTSARGDSALEMGSNLPYVNLGTGRTVKQVSCGYYHACAILDNDQVKYMLVVMCFGRVNMLVEKHVILDPAKKHTHTRSCSRSSAGDSTTTGS
jgi:alpha-tubulin suppressor-like RCC1 family protein